MAPSYPLPDHAHVISTPRVWMEGDAIDQLARVARTEGCVCAVGLPDLHPGPGVPIGATFAFRGRVWPALVGGDAGCGVRMVGVPKIKAKGDALERRVLTELEDEPLDGVDAGSLLEAVWTLGARGLAEVRGVPETLAAFAEAEPEGASDVGPCPEAAYGEQLGTVGGGNHFAEISRVHQIVDADGAEEAGLRRSGFAVLVHSGSRGLGRHLAERWAGRMLDEDSDDHHAWLGDIRGALNFASANRLVLAWRLLRAVGAARPQRTSGGLELVHNTVQAIDDPTWGRIWLHRKGAAPAAARQLTVVLGSRGAPSWVMRGTGSRESLYSVAHGAGRRLNRSQAIELMRHRYKRAEMARTASGGRVVCDDRDALYAEHPDCYKPIEPVIEALEQAGTAERIAALLPLVTVKR